MDEHEQTDAIQVIQPSALEHLTRGEIDMQIATARKYPRQIDSFLKRATDMATLAKGTAQSAYYVLPRREYDKEKKQWVQKEITGPSIRMAEMAASAFGNLRFGSRVVEIGAERVTAQGFCHDLETNNAVAVEVSAGIVSSRGKRYPDHMVTTTANATAAKALRNAVFRIIPRAYIDQVLKRCKEVVAGQGKTMIERWKEVVGAFARHGADEARVLRAIDRPGVADVTTNDIVRLYGLLTAVEDGEISVDRALESHSEDAGEPSTIADEMTDDQKAEIEAKQAKSREFAELVAELKEIDPDAVENATRNAPDIDHALVALRAMKARADGWNEKSK